jgi:membrane fusion protein (multidrug efflux system)
MIRFSFLSFLLVFFFLNACNKKTTSQKKPITIQYVVPVKKDIPIYKEYVGQTYGKSDVQVVARVEGIITSMHYKEGEFIQKGKLLYTIDPLQYKTKVDEAQGALDQAQSEFVNAQENLKRIKPLAEMKAVSQRELDEAIARVNSANAKVQSMKASLKNQNIRLDYCHVLAPVSGVIGISPVKVGDYISPLNGKSTLNTISDVSEMRIRFSITENEYLNYTQSLKGKDTLTNNQLNQLELWLSNGEMYPYKGKINFKDRSIDPTTGAMTIESTFPNPEKLLIPGLYVKVRIQVQNLKETIAIPQRAVKEIQGMYQVNIINDKNELELRIVKVGDRVGDDWIIWSGLKGNERVAILGSNFLVPGTVVDPLLVVKDSIQ